MNQMEAEAIGVEIMNFLSENEALLFGFLGASGAAVEDLRGASQNPEFMGFLIEYLLQSGDETVLEFCQNHNRKPEALFWAKAHFQGEEPHWT